MATIFISHSKRDAKLVHDVKKFLENVGHTPIIEEFIPTEKQESIPYKEIQKNIDRSDFLFLFLTDNVVMTPHTKSWVNHEVGLAAARSIRLFVFERLGEPISFPVPYLTDYALFDMDQTNDILELQKITKNLGKIRKDILTAAGGAALGSVLGPIGMVLGAAAGYYVGPKQPKPTTVKCGTCNTEFNYYSTHKYFCCPVCKDGIEVGG